VGAKVFANSLEVSGKASGNKSIAAMPDVCLSPPSPPAGPIPIPYPNTAMASDTSSGSKSVMVGGKEAGVKNKSSYKKSNGNQPATNSFGAGVVSHKLTGAVYFSAYSFDVKFEGKNVTRFGDLTTGNHTNTPAAGNADLTSSIAGLAVAMEGSENECEDLRAANKEARDSMKTAKHKRNPNKEHKGLQAVGNKNSTITHGKFTKNGTTVVVRAASNILVEKYDNSFSPYPGKKSGDSNMNSEEGCGPHNYPENPALPHTCHTEARIIESLFKPPNSGKGGKLLLAIDWPRPKKGKRPCDPCIHCNNLICAAESDNCMKIEICNDEDPSEKERACQD